MVKKRKDIVVKPLEDGNQMKAIRSNADIVVFTGGTGGGKNQPLYTPILTTHGWIKMGDVKMGEEMVSPFNDEPSYVDGIFPQGVTPYYKLTTTDGRSVECGDEHLWTVRTEKQVENYRKGHNSYFVKTTLELIEMMKNPKSKGLYIPVAKPYKGIYNPDLVSSYVLGVWIGDGCRKECVSISNDEQDIIEHITNIFGSKCTLHKDYGYTNRIIFNDKVKAFRDYLIECGLYDKYSCERFIPRPYFDASLEQRMDLLKGLMDSDGCVGEKNRYTYCTTSNQLKEDFLELCRGLGYIATCVRDHRIDKYASKECWKINIQTNDIIFSSKKHLSRYYENLKKYKNKNREYKHDHIKIKSIEYMGEIETQCISVTDKDHLYITKDFIVTHNTFALYYAPISYLSQKDNAKSVCFMRNVSDFWGVGKVSDTLKKMYPLIDRSVKKQPQDPVGEIIKNQVDMGLKFYNGSEIKFQQLDNENPIVIDKITKGLQAKKLIFDECNKFTWRTITSFMARMRSDSDGKAQIYLAQNPERNCFMRQLCGCGEHGGGWIDDDGKPIKEMNGRVMYFNMEGGDLNKTYFGKTKREVYLKCKDHIDELLKVDKDMTYEDFILSMVFFDFDVRDNKAMLAKNKKYRGLAANSATASSSFGSNWNFSIDDELEDLDTLANVQVSKADIESMFICDESPSNCRLLKRRITLDMATTGSDNFVLKYWELYEKYGWYCRDIEYSMYNTNKQAVSMIAAFRKKHNCDEKELILDVQGFGFLKEVFPRAFCYSGAAQTSNKGKNQFRSFKDESAHIAADMIRNGFIHYSRHLANMRYNHKHMEREGGTTILNHMKFESVIFQFGKTPNGRITFMDKTEQKKLLKGMSPDLTDNLIMLCGATCYDCYRIMSEGTGFKRKKMEDDKLFEALSANDEENEDYDFLVKKKAKIRNQDNILNILSTI